MVHIYELKIIAESSKWVSAKVVVPATYNEWRDGPPLWIADHSISEEYNFSVFLYQKLNHTQPNFISFNRGSESGVYLKFIVDHYDDLPDITIFVHALPQHHSHHWLSLVKCINPDADYYSINVTPFEKSRYACRELSKWHHHVSHECWTHVMDTLRGYEGQFDQTTAYQSKSYDSLPSKVCYIASNQFFVRRQLIRTRPFEFWKKLYYMIGQSQDCTANDHERRNHSTIPALHVSRNMSPKIGSFDAVGRNTQGIVMEHLSHVVFGRLPLIHPRPNHTVSYWKQYFNISCLRRYLARVKIPLD